MKIQFTLFSKSGKYKPMSTLLEVESIEEYKTHNTEYKTKAIQKIANQRYMSKTDLKKYEYTIMKVRVYDPVKIEQEKKERYEQIKKERGWI